jgi:hypothetical protein
VLPTRYTCINHKSNTRTSYNRNKRTHQRTRWKQKKSIPIYEYLTVAAITAKKQESLVVVDECAVLPDLALGPGLDLDLAHLHHGRREDLEEEIGWPADGAEDVSRQRRP